jgi:2-polyprenyl-3-methyl-5-hydroxy-6-metoxy-1,4-benzoquinol methylase
MICEHKKQKLVLETETHQLRQCLSCNFIFANPIKKSNFISFSKNYLNYYRPEKAARFGAPVELFVKFFRFLRAWRIAALKPKIKNILDIGSGRGWTLYFLKKYFNYKRTAGTQIEVNAYKFSKEKLGLEIYPQDLLEIFIEGNFSIITAWHVLEHLRNPEQYIKKISGLLDSAGRLLIEVPNYNSWSRRLTGKHWLALDLKHHLFFFTPDSLIALLEKYNFKIEKFHSFSLEQSAFTSAQSLVNLITNSDSLFFSCLQGKKCGLKIVWHAFLFSILFFPCLLINFFLYFSRYGEVINIVARKND